MRKQFIIPAMAAGILTMGMVSGASARWNISGVDSGDFVGTYNAIGVDGAGNPHIAYSDNELNLNYARWDGNQWVKEVAAGTLHSGSDISMVLDSDGLPHIAYRGASESPSEISYAHYDGTEWEVDIVDGDHGMDPSIAIDSDGDPGIAYRNEGLKYAHKQGPNGNVPPSQINDRAQISGISLAFDSDDNPHISYYHEESFPDMQLVYAYFDGSEWVETDIDDPADTSFMSSEILIDSSDTPHIVYSRGSSLKYAVLTDGDWEVEEVDNWDQWGSAAMDSNDSIHIAYRARHNQVMSLKYAYGSAGEWETETVESEDTGRMSLALDTAGNPHISYDCADSDELKYASTVPLDEVGDPEEDEVEFEGDLDVLGYTFQSGARAAAADSQNNIIVTGNCWEEDAILTVKYDTNLNVISSTTYSGEEGDVSAHSVAVDSQDRIIIAGAKYIDGDDHFYIRIYDSEFNVEAYHWHAVDRAMYRTYVAVDSEDNIIITGRDDDDFLTIKYDSNLEQIGIPERYEGVGRVDQPAGVAVDSDDNIIVSGYSSDQDNNADFFTIKYSPSLTQITNRSNNLEEDNYGRGVAVTPDDEIVVTGSMGNSILTQKYNSGLTAVLGEDTYEDEDGASPHAIAVDSEGNIAVTGDHYTPTLWYKGYLMLYSPDFEILGSVTYWMIGVYSNSSYGVAFDRDNNIIAIGRVAGDREVVIKFDGVAAPQPGPDPDPAPVEEEGEAEVVGGSGGSVNPNEGETARIQFKSNQPGSVTVRVYSRRGQLVWEDSKETDGSDDEIEWAARNAQDNVVSSGIYIIHISGPGIDVTRQVPIVK